jgi:Ca-activated chloride channel family protein
MQMLVGTGALFCFAAASQSQNAQRELLNSVPYRSSDGRVTGWKITIPGNRPLASPAIAEGKIFVGGGFGSHEFYAFDATTGRRLWTYQTADDGPTAAVVQDGVIAFNTESCEIEVLTTSGRRLWKKWLGDPLMSMPAISGDHVYMAYPDSRGGGKYYVAAFDLRTGVELWKYPLPAEIITAPVIENDRLYLATVDGSIVSLNQRDGGKIWQENRNATSAPAMWKEQCFFSRREETKVRQNGKLAVQQNEAVAARGIASTSETVTIPDTRQKADYLDYAKRANSVKEQASQSFDASVGFAGANKGSSKMSVAVANIGQASVHGIWAYQGSKPFVHNERLYSSMGVNARSVDPKSGKVIWSRDLHEARRASAIDDVLTPPVIVNGKVFIGTASGEVYVLSEKTGDVLWKVELGEPISFQPTVANGRIYVGTDRGSLFCLLTGDSADDGWYMWGANAAHNGSGAR